MRTNGWVVASMVWAAAGCGDAAMSRGAGADAASPAMTGGGSGGQAPVAGTDTASGGSGPTSGSGGTQAAGTGGAGTAADTGRPPATADAAASPDAAQHGDAGAAPAVDPLSTDRGAFFGDSRCDALGALFCDGFEGASIAAAWQKQGGGSAAIDSSQKARGESSLHVHTEGNGFSYLKLSQIFPVANNRYYGRMFVRFSALPTAPDWAHWTIAEAAGDGDGSLIRVGGQWDRKQNRFGVGSDGGPTGDWTNLDRDPPDAPRAPPEGEWVCIEWLHDGDADVTQFFWDAEQHESLATTREDHGGQDVPYVMPEFRSVWVGFWLYQANPTPDRYDVWIDEVAFDDARIGCVR